jgi:hypothetical protein
MDKSVITSAILLTLIGVVALNIKGIVNWIWQYMCDNILYSLLPNHLR